MERRELIKKILLSEAKKKDKKSTLTPQEKLANKLYEIDKEVLLDYIQTSQEEGKWDEDLSKSILRTFNIIVNDHTLGFFEALYDVNSKIDYKPVDRVERIIIPKLKKFKIDYSVQMNKYGREYWEQIVNAWTENEINQRLDNGELNWYDGEFRDDDYYDSDSGDVDTDIEEIS